MFWLGAIVSLCYVPGLTGAYIATQWPVLAIVLPFAFWREGEFTRWHAVWLAFVAYAAVLSFFSPAPNAAVWGVWLITIMGMALWFGSTIKSPRMLYAGLAFGGAVSSLAAAAEYFGIVSIPHTSDPVAGLYVNSVQHATVLALIAVALATERMWFWILPLAPGFVLAQSRGAALALAIGLLGCRVRSPWLLVFVVAAGLAVMASPLSPSDSERVLIWRSAIDNLTLLGWGPGVFFSIVLPIGGKMIYPEHAHNDALQLVFEYGVAAALPISIFGYGLLRTKAREWPIILAFVTASCYSMPLWMPVASFLALVAVGRVLRSDAVACDNCRNGGLDVVPRCHETSSGAVSVAPHH